MNINDVNKYNGRKNDEFYNFRYGYNKYFYNN